MSRHDELGVVMMSHGKSMNRQYETWAESHQNGVKSGI